MKAYLKGNPGQADWSKTNLHSIGYRLVEQNEQQYIGARAATWDMELKPRPNHVDDRVMVTAPLTKPGAYLLIARMADGNTSRILVWLSDTVIVKKNLDGSNLDFVADAISGKPVARANVDLFGWKVVQVVPNQNQFRVETMSFNRTTDDAGQLHPRRSEPTSGLSVAHHGRKDKDGFGVLTGSLTSVSATSGTAVPTIPNKQYVTKRSGDLHESPIKLGDLFPP